MRLILAKSIRPACEHVKLTGDYEITDEEPVYDGDDL